MYSLFKSGLNSVDDNYLIIPYCYDGTPFSTSRYAVAASFFALLGSRTYQRFAMTGKITNAIYPSYRDDIKDKMVFFIPVSHDYFSEPDFELIKSGLSKVNKYLKVEKISDPAILTSDFPFFDSLVDFIKPLNIKTSE